MLFVSTFLFIQESLGQKIDHENVFNIDIRSVSWASNQHISMISEGSYDTDYVYMFKVNHLKWVKLTTTTKKT